MRRIGTNEILARGRAFGESRIVCNHHWYSDVVWGRFMGAATVARLHADPTFRADLEAAKAEFAALRAKGVPPTGDCKAEAAALALGFQASSVTAIDILLEPDATMLQHSDANNARLLKVFPKGFALDATHTSAHHDDPAFRPHGGPRQGLCRRRQGARPRQRDRA